MHPSSSTRAAHHWHARRALLVEQRGITLTLYPAVDPYLFDRLLFHAACPFKGGKVPAIVAAVCGPCRYLRGIWRIRLDGFARKVERLGLGDALAWSQMTEQPAWAGGSTSGVAGIVLPLRFRRVTIVTDADEAGMKAAAKLANRLKDEGRTVRIVRTVRPPTGFKDANAALQASAAA